MDRCKAFFDGIEVQVSFSMTRSHGTTPDVGQLVFRRGGTLPSSPHGDLVFKIGDTTIVTFRDCLLQRPTERISGTRDIVYQVLDRRWRWKTPVLFGEYNVRDQGNVLIEGTEKSARELALLAMEACHAPNVGVYDVDVLPEDVDLAPYVKWHYEPAAVFLDKLCALCGCVVNLRNDDSVVIEVENTGSEPDDAGLMYPVENGLVTTPVPPFITAFAGETLFESWLLTEDVGMEIGGDVKPIEMLSYKPDGGWANVDPSHGYDTRILAKMRGDYPDEVIDKTVEIAKRSVYRMRRIIGFPESQLFFPGFALEEPEDHVADLPAEGDLSKVYQLNRLSGATVRLIWDGNGYRGITVSPPPGLWGVVDPRLIFNSYSDALCSEHSTRDDAENSRTDEGDPNLVICPPGAAVFDTRIILPLLNTRVEFALNEYQQRARKPVEVCGVFFDDDFKRRNKVTTQLAAWKDGIRVDTEKGHVHLSKPAYVRGNAGIEQAKMYVRCGYRYRRTSYGNLYHRQFNLSTGSSLEIANATVNRTDISEMRVQNYLEDYNDLSVTGEPIVNTSVVDSILEASATEFFRQYENTVGPKRKQYTPFRAVDTNGIVKQVTYQGGVGQLGLTIVSVGASLDITQSPAKTRQIQELQRRRAEFALQDFRAEQAVIGNVNDGGINGFNVAGIA